MQILPCKLPLVSMAVLPLFCVLPLTGAMPAFWQTILCTPTAYLAASLLQSPWERLPEGCWIGLPALSVMVGPECSGAHFFALLWTLMWTVRLSSTARTPHLDPLPQGAMRPPDRELPLPSGERVGVRVSSARLIQSLAQTGMLAYALTLLANTARIVLGWGTAVWARHALPASLHAGVHLATGIIVFTSFLVAGYLLATRLDRVMKGTVHGHTN